MVLEAPSGVHTLGPTFPYRRSIPSLRAGGRPVPAVRAVHLALTRRGDGCTVLDELGGVFVFGDAPLRRVAPRPGSTAPVADVRRQPEPVAYPLMLTGR